MSITSIYQCRNLFGMIHYCITPKAQQKGERVASMYCDLGNYNTFLNYGLETTKAHKRKVQAFTLLQSFPSTEFDVDNAEHISCVNELGRKLAYELFPNSPCLVITHADSDGKCLHNHIAVINHDLASNGCIKTNRHYRYVRQANDKIMEKYGLEICEPAVQKQTQREYWTNKRNHWLDELKVKVDKALSNSISIKEFQDNLLLEGISATFYKSNGELKEHFTFMVRDSDGKEHKKRSDKLGEEYTRNALQQKLLCNKKEREQKAIMPMSQWIELQKEKSAQVELLSTPGNKIVFTEKCDEVASKTEPIVSTERRDKMQSKEKTQNNKADSTGIASQELFRKQKYQEAKKELLRIQNQIKILMCKYDDGTDTEEDDKRLESLERKKREVSIQIYELSKPLNEKVVLDERLSPNYQSCISKGLDYSL